MPLSAENRYYTTIGCGVCCMIASILFTGTKSFEENPWYVSGIGLAHCWPFLWNAFSESLEAKSSQGLRQYLVVGLMVGLMGAFSWLAVLMPSHFEEFFSPWILGITFVGIFLGQLSVLAGEDDGIGELFAGVCMGSISETEAVTNGLLLYFLCTLLSAKKLILMRLSRKRVPLEYFEKELVRIHDDLKDVEDTSNLAKLNDVERELASLIDEMREVTSGMK